MGGVTTYYRLACPGNSGTATGVFMCDEGCGQCAVNDFEVKTSDMNQCLVKNWNCLVGNPSSCQPQASMFTQQCTVVDDSATGWAVSVLGALVGVILVAV